MNAISLIEVRKYYLFLILRHNSGIPALSVAVQVEKNMLKNEHHSRTREGKKRKNQMNGLKERERERERKRAGERKARKLADFQNPIK